MHARRYVIHRLKPSTVEGDSEYLELLIDVPGSYRPINPLSYQKNALEEVCLLPSACATCSLVPLLDK